MNRGRYQMSQKELQRLPVIEAVLAKQMTQIEAAECLDLSTRQIRRLERRVQGEGASGLMHRSCGQPAHHRFEEGLQQRVLGLIRRKYSDFGPTLACEKLAEAEKIRLSDETLRQWMRAEGIFNGRRRSRPHRQWRQRSACLGQMVQMDGSHHRWLEERGPEFVLMGYVDDATGRVERLFKTFQDRLVKEMRLEKIQSPEAANRFLKGFLARYNRRFSRVARQTGDLHRPAPAGRALAEILCIKEPRVVANDGTIQIEGRRLQLLPPGLRPLAQRGVTVAIRPQGRMRHALAAAEESPMAKKSGAGNHHDNPDPEIFKASNLKAKQPLKPDISILVETGHFNFGCTLGVSSVVFGFPLC